jgi:16S rRNA (guanine527-N7)-methyltransferase
LTPAAIAALLVPYLEPGSLTATRDDDLFSKISTYLDLLLRWNARTNLTAIRSPEEIVLRHFGESFFAAQLVVGAGNSAESLADVGSGAGFPGIPMKLWNPALRVTLIESHQKKATFLREVIRALQLTGIEVQASRAEDVYLAFDFVTLRAVDHFERILPVAAGLLNSGGRLVLLIGEEQASPAKAILPSLEWEIPRLIPNSECRIALVGRRLGESSQ